MLHLDRGRTDALMALCETRGTADGQILNIGNPDNNFSIRELTAHPGTWMDPPPRREGPRRSVPAEEYYSNGYDDMNRVPHRKMRERMGWRPKVGPGVPCA